MNLFIANYLIFLEIGLQWTTVSAQTVPIESPATERLLRREKLPTNPSEDFNSDYADEDSIRLSAPYGTITGNEPSRGREGENNRESFTPAEISANVYPVSPPFPFPRLLHPAIPNRFEIENPVKVKDFPEERFSGRVQNEFDFFTEEKGKIYGEKMAGMDDLPEWTSTSPENGPGDGVNIGEPVLASSDVTHKVKTRKRPKGRPDASAILLQVQQAHVGNTYKNTGYKRGHTNRRAKMRIKVNVGGSQKANSKPLVDMTPNSSIPATSNSQAFSPNLSENLQQQQTSASSGQMTFIENPQTVQKFQSSTISPRRPKKGFSYVRLREHDKPIIIVTKKVKNSPISRGNWTSEVNDFAQAESSQTVQIHGVAKSPKTKIMKLIKIRGRRKRKPPPTTTTAKPTTITTVDESSNPEFSPSVKYIKTLTTTHFAGGNYPRPSAEINLEVKTSPGINRILLRPNNISEQAKDEAEIHGKKSFMPSLLFPCQILIGHIKNENSKSKWRAVPPNFQKISNSLTPTTAKLIDELTNSNTFKSSKESKEDTDFAENAQLLKNNHRNPSIREENNFARTIETDEKLMFNDAYFAQSRRKESATTFAEEINTDNNKSLNVSGRKKRETIPSAGREPETKEETLKLEETKRPLDRLTGLDFLTRYQKTKSKPNEKVDDFWKVSNLGKETGKDSHKPNKFERKNLIIKKTRVESSTSTSTNKPRDSKKSGKFQKNSTDKPSVRVTVRSTTREGEQVQRFRIVVTPTPPIKSRNIPPKSKNDSAIHRFSSTDSREKITKMDQKPDEKVQPSSAISAKPNVEKSESEMEKPLPFRVDEKSKTKKYSVREGGENFKLPEAPKYDSFIRNFGTGKLEDSEEDEKSEKSNYPDQLPVKYTNEETKHGVGESFRSKTTHYVSLNRNRKIQESPELSTIGSYIGEYITPKSEPVDPEPTHQGKSAERDDHVEENRLHAPRYVAINRNREAWKNAETPDESSIKSFTRDYTTPVPLSSETKRVYTTVAPQDYDDSSDPGPMALHYSSTFRYREPWDGEESLAVSSGKPYIQEYTTPFSEPADNGETHHTKQLSGTEETQDLITKAPQYVSINRHGGGWKSDPYPARYEYPESDTPSVTIIRAERPLNTNKGPVVASEGFRITVPDYNSVNRNREIQEDSEGGVKVTSSRPSYREFTSSAKFADFSEEPTTPKVQVHNEVASYQTEIPQLSREPEKILYIGEATEEPETPGDGPVLYYIVDEKTKRGRWISYPSDKRKGKFSSLKKKRKFLIIVEKSPRESEKRTN